MAKLPRGANQHASIEAPTQDEAAQLLNVSGLSVQRARTVLDSGTPELAAAVEQGRVSVRAAADVATFIRRYGGEVAGAVLLVNATRDGKMMPAAKLVRDLEVHMETRSESNSASVPTPSLPKKPDTSSVSERLTNSEIESLLQNKRESIAWALREFAKDATSA